MLQVGDQSYAQGQFVTGRVTKVGDSAVFVLLPNNVRGIIRREWLPEELRKRECRYVISRGAEVKAKVRGIDNRSLYILLDLDSIVRDPWIEARPTFRKGQLVRGEVRDIKPYGVFVEIDQGVSALIPIDEIPGASQETIERVLFPGDLVEAKITVVSDEKRQLSLSIERHLQTLRRYRQDNRDRFTEDSPLIRSVARMPAPAGAAASAQLQGGAGRVKRILVVDDSLHYLNGMRRWLCRAGYDVELAQTGTEGSELAIARGFDLILMDARMPDISGMEAARRIKRDRPSTKIAIVTGDERPPEPSEMTGVDVIGVISKFGGLSAIEQLIISVESEAEAPAPFEMFQNFGQEVELIQKASQAQHTAQGLAGVLGGILSELRVATGAQASAVFDMDPATKTMVVLAQNGTVPGDGYGVQDLKYSPVRDVIRDGQPILENQVLRNEKKFSYLLRYRMFESCIGLRIEGEHKRRFRHALFLFHRAPDRFTPAHVQQALLVSKMLALAIERSEIELRLLEMQSMAVAGLLRSGLLHEINNHLNDIEISVSNLRSDYEDLCTDPHRPTTDGQFLDDIGDSLGAVTSASANLRAIAESFLGLLRAEKDTYLDVNEIINRAKQVVEPEAGIDVHIIVSPEAKIPSTYGVASRLERAFANVMLNAVQHIKVHSKREDMGILLVKTTYEPRDGERPIKVRFIDTGPGIHRKDFERIFERGVSSRRDGSGLGLYISRGLINSMGGRISIEDSLMFVGSSFLIELPSAADTEIVHDHAAK